MAIGPSSELGISLFEETDPVELRSGYSSEDVETVIRAVYRQVLGNAYVMESERLEVPESQLKRGELSVREFVRQVAKSSLYTSRFFDIVPRYRNIELNFKHLLGRAPDNFDEMAMHSQLLDNGGHSDEIDSYIDSDEYQNAYGEDTVPFYRGYRTSPGKQMVGFTHLFLLLRGPSSSDKASMKGKSAVLNKLAINRTAVPVVSPNVGPYNARSQFANVPGTSQWGSKVLRITVGAYSDNVSTNSYVITVPLERVLSEVTSIKRKGGKILEIASVTA
jgi:phycoerythrin-associated linker protein